LRLLQPGDEEGADACVEALPDPALRGRLEEAHAVEAARVARLLAKLTVELELNVRAMGSELDRADPPPPPLAAAAAVASTPVSNSSSNSRSRNSPLTPSASSSSLAASGALWSPALASPASYPGSDRAVRSAAASHTSAAEYAWMSDVVAMLSLELWRKEEVRQETARVCDYPLPPPHPLASLRVEYDKLPMPPPPAQLLATLLEEDAAEGGGNAGFHGTKAEDRRDAVTPLTHFRRVCC
jgi:hypothetical protein